MSLWWLIVGVLLFEMWVQVFVVFVGVVWVFCGVVYFVEYDFDDGCFG